MSELIVFSSSRIKQNHAKYLCRDYDLSLVSFKEKTYRANYIEPRLDNREELLEVSFNNALKQAKGAGFTKTTPFFIEDTSVCINALSVEGDEIPGVNIKYWMKETSFEDIDFELVFKGNDRRATVRSDILLYLPNSLENPHHFTSFSEGNICDVEEVFETNAIYPWLDNETFNKWFVPVGETKVISQLPIEKADLYDFRKGAFELMLNCLESNGYAKKEMYQGASKTGSLGLSENEFCHLVVGLSCAGKTTVADYLSSAHEFFHVEASDFMHMLYRERHGLNSSVGIGKFAVEVLDDQPLIIVDKVLSYLEDFDWPRVVVTGFRLDEEATRFVEYYTNSQDVPVYYIDSDQNVRHERKEIRNRTSNNDMESLKKRDLRELNMGLEKIKLRNDVVFIENDGSISDFYTKYESISSCSGNKFKNSNEKNSDPNRLTLNDLLILTLYFSRTDGESSPFYTTTEICNMLNLEFQLLVPKNKNNVSRYFNQKNYVYYDVVVESRKNKYRLSNTGVGMARRILFQFSYVRNNY